jgi:phosphate transport system protein
MRERFLKRLRMVHDDLLRMGSRVEHALADGMLALSTWDTGLARHVIADDQEIDVLRTAIENAVLGLLAIQQPILCTDLRTLMTASAIAGELERAGDYAKGIAKRVDRCLHTPMLLEPPPKLQRMGSLAITMLHTSLDAFVRLDVPLARSLAARDEEMDSLEDQVIAELIGEARQQPSMLDCTIYLINIAHTLERLADRTTNIGERVIFIVTSRVEPLNS